MLTNSTKPIPKHRTIHILTKLLSTIVSSRWLGPLSCFKETGYWHRLYSHLMAMIDIMFRIKNVYQHTNASKEKKLQPNNKQNDWHWIGGTVNKAFSSLSFLDSLVSRSLSDLRALFSSARDPQLANSSSNTAWITVWIITTNYSYSRIKNIKQKENIEE